MIDVAKCSIFDPRKTWENLKSLAGVGVADCHHEEAEPKGQHDDVQHGILLIALAGVFTRVARGGGLRWINAGSAPDPASCRISGLEVPLHAYVFEAAAKATL